MIYLLFFGKSQSFTWEAFDENGHCPEFHQQFPGFEALESKLMTIDRRENYPIWARYRLKNNQGRYFSLLKVYAVAQAFDGSRIAGSSYGVALMSDQDLSWHPTNYDILEAARVNFSKLVLQQQKFMKTNFLSDAQAVWKGMVRFAEGNLLQKVVQKPFKKFPTQPLMTASFPDIREASPTLERLSAPYVRFYATADPEHLARMQAKWGADRFPIHASSTPNPSPANLTPSPTQHPKVKTWLMQPGDLEVKEKEESFSAPPPWIKPIAWFVTALGWGLATYSFLQPTPKPVDPLAALRTWQFETFSQANKRDTLTILLQNLKIMETDTSTKYRQAVVRDAQTLGLDSLTLDMLVDTQP